MKDIHQVFLFGIFAEGHDLDLLRVGRLHEVHVEDALHNLLGSAAASAAAAVAVAAAVVVPDAHGPYPALPAQRHPHLLLQAMPHGDTLQELEDLDDLLEEKLLARRACDPGQTGLGPPQLLDQNGLLLLGVGCGGYGYQCGHNSTAL